jgi:arylsulfatase A-like enzyme
VISRPGRCNRQLSIRRAGACWSPAGGGQPSAGASRWSRYCSLASGEQQPTHRFWLLLVAATWLVGPAHAIGQSAPLAGEAAVPTAERLPLAERARGAAVAARRPPNILMVVADDLGFSDLGCFGGEIATPQLDSLAAGGLRLTSFYNTGRCWPTRGAMLTGYYAQQIRRDSFPGGRQGGQGVRPEWAPLLPQRLEPAGYVSYLSGKWHVDGTAAEGGFRKSMRVEDHDRYFGPQRVLIDDQLVTLAAGDDYYVTGDIVGHAITCLTDHQRQHPDRPFFSVVAFTAPHFPLHAPAEDVGRYQDRYRSGWDRIRGERLQRMDQLGVLSLPLPPLEPDVGPPYHFPEHLAQLGPGEVNRELDWADLDDQQRDFQGAKMAIHAAMVDVMDRELGRLLDFLKQSGQWEDTLIIFFSDNGASAEIMVRGDGHDPTAEPGSAGSYLCLGPGWSSAANTPFRRHKTWVHEGGIATACLLHWPAGIATELQGTVCRQAGHVIDLLPTLLDAASLPVEPVPTGPPLPGISLLPWLCGPTAVEPRTLWWLHEGNRAILEGDWKLVAARDQPWELYDLSVDRNELRSLSEVQAARRDAMAQRWQSLLERFQQQVQP